MSTTNIRSLLDTLAAINEAATPPATQVGVPSSTGGDTFTQPGSTVHKAAPDKAAQDARVREMYALTGGRSLTRNPDGTLSTTIDDPENDSEDSTVLTFDKDYNLISRTRGGVPVPAPAAPAAKAPAAPAAKGPKTPGEVMATPGFSIAKLKASTAADSIENIKAKMNDLASKNRGQGDPVYDVFKAELDKRAAGGVPTTGTSPATKAPSATKRTRKAVSATTAAPAAPAPAPAPAAGRLPTEQDWDDALKATAPSPAAGGAGTPPGAPPTNPAAGGTPPSGGAGAGDPAALKNSRAGLYSLGTARKESMKAVTAAQGKTPEGDVGNIFVDPQAFLTQFMRYAGAHGGAGYNLAADTEMFNALKTMWMNSGGATLRESARSEMESFSTALRYLTEERDRLIVEQIYREPIYEMTHRAARMLVEADVSQEQIKRIFRLVAGGAARGMNKADADAKDVSNRSLLGKAVDIPKAAHDMIKRAFDRVDDAISNTSVMKGFNTAFDKIQADLLRATGGKDGAVGKALQGYRELAARHPYIQTGLYAGLVALAGLASGGIGAPAIVGGMKVLDRLLQGDRLSSALLKGLATGGAAYGIGQIKNLIADPSGGGTGGVGDAGPRIDDSGAAGDPAAFDQADNFVPDEPAGSATPEFTDDSAPGETPGYTDDSAPGETPGNTGGKPTGQTPASSAATSSSATPPVDTSGYPTGGDPYNPGMSSDAASDTPQRPVARPPINIQPSPSDAPAGPGMKAPAGFDVAPGVQAPEIPQTVADIKAQDWYSQLSKEAKDWLGGAKRDDPFILDSLIKAVPSAANVVPPELIDAAAMAAGRAANAAAGGPNLEESQRNRWIDYDRTSRAYALRESRGKPPTRNFYIKNDGVDRMFKLVTNEGLWDTIKGAAKSAWKSMSNKITYENLELTWRRNYGQNPATAKSAPIQTVVEFLRKQGVTDYLIQWALDKMKLNHKVNPDPVATDPVTTGPVKTDPVTTGPVKTDPVTTGPVTTNPELVRLQQNAGLADYGGGAGGGGGGSASVSGGNSNASSAGGNSSVNIHNIIGGGAGGAAGATDPAKKAARTRSTPAMTKGMTTIADGASLLTNYRKFASSGKSISPAVRAVIRNALRTTLKTVREDVEQLKMIGLLKKIV